MNARVTAHIDIDAFRHNLQRVKSYAPHAKVIAMIKANAYGHGLLFAAHGLCEADAFAVERLPQALSLREHGIHQPIILLSGFNDLLELQEMVAHQLIPVIHTSYQITLLEKIHLPQPLPIWIKIDTGMHRLGFSEQEVLNAYERLSKIKYLLQPFGWMTHFARPDEVENPATSKQVACFDRVIQWEGPQSLANSAAIMTRPETHRDYVRPGIMLYGISPFRDKIGADFDLRPVMTLTSQLISIRECKKGDTIGYGGTWECPEDMRVGVVSVGYGDGYPRHAENGTPVLVNGKLCPLVGRVSMDFITIDLRKCPEAQVGDAVTLWGNGLPVEQIALCSDTIAYELVTRIMPRVNVVSHS